METTPDPTVGLRPRLAEIVAALSLATDLGRGQPMEHGLRGCLIATRWPSALSSHPTRSTLSVG